MKKINDLITLLEDKGYVRVKIYSDWAYKTIIGEQKSVTDKIEETIKNNTNKKDFFYIRNDNIINFFNTRDFIEYFDEKIMKGEISHYFDWFDEGFTYYLYEDFENILEQYGYTIEHPHPQNSSYCYCVNEKKREEKRKKEKARKKEIDDFIASLD